MKSPDTVKEAVMGHLRRGDRWDRGERLVGTHEEIMGTEIASQEGDRVERREARWRNDKGRGWRR